MIPENQQNSEAIEAAAAEEAQKKKLRMTKP
jgi:hypothetical protein